MAGNSTADLIRSGVESLGSGKVVDSDSIGSSPTSGGSVGGKARFDQGEESVTTQESTSEDLLPGGDDTPDGALDTKEPASSGEPPVKEVITITDDKGRRKIEVDWNDRDKLKKFVQMAYGARKWQAERDSARQEASKVATERTELQGHWNTLEQAYQKQGVEGVIDLLEGKRGAFQEWQKRAIDKAKFLDNASPEEAEAFRAKESADLSRKELERIRKENEDFRKQMSATKEEADLRSLEGRVHPVFDRYRFSDKLGDSNNEHRLDEMLWNSALKRLEPYEEKGITLTPELIEREFRTEAAALRKIIGNQAEKKASRVIDQKKQEATENAQASVKAGYRSGGGNTAREARDLIQKGNLTDLLSNWKKYGSLFNK